MIAKKHTLDGKLILVVCDEEIIGKKYETEKLQLDLSSAFFKGISMEEDQILELAKKSYLLNLSGKKSIELFKRMNFIDQENIIEIKGIPHVEVLIGNTI